MSKEDDFPELQCRVCFEIPAPPWTGCHIGHPICDACYDRLPEKICPSCFENMETRPRLLAAEQLVARLKLPVKVTCPHEGCGEQVPLSVIEPHTATCGYRLLDMCPAKASGLPCQGKCSGDCRVRDVVTRIQTCWPETIVMDALPSNGMPTAVLPDSEWYPRAWLFRKEGLLVTHEAYDNFWLRFWTVDKAPLQIAFRITTDVPDYECSVRGAAVFVDDAWPNRECGVMLPLSVREHPSTRLAISLQKRPADGDLAERPSKKRRVGRKGKD